MSKIVFTGASTSRGTGWDLPTEKDFMWVHLVHKNCFSDLDLINASIRGAPNNIIFSQTIKQISSNTDIAYLICSWIGLIRYIINPGFELYPTTVSIEPCGLPFEDVNLNTVNISKEYIENIQNRFLALHHFHYEICKFLEYIQIINALCKKLNIKVYHVNDNCPWDKNYFTRLTNVTPNQYTEFTKTEILNVDNRSDNEIFKLYKKMHDEYDHAGGIQSESWINLYDSWTTNKIDVNHDGRHPGKQSNFNYYTTVKNFLETQ